jgi:hypothetical protein
MAGLTVADRLDIHELIARGNQAIDFGEPEAYAAVFTPDGVLVGEDSPRRGGAVRYRLEGHDELRTFAADAAAKRQGYGRHWVNSTVLSIEDGGASGISYLAFLTIDPATVACDIMVSAVLHDRYAKTAEGWRISERIVTYDG